MAFFSDGIKAALASNPFASTAKGKRPSDPAAAEKQKKLANMFSPPTEIMFMGDFQAARQVCAAVLHIGVGWCAAVGASAAAILLLSVVVAIVLDADDVIAVDATVAVVSPIDCCF